MKWLVWKEYGLNRPILMVGALLLAAPHVNAPILAWYEAGPILRGGVPLLWQKLAFTAGCSLALSQLTLCLLGANAIAGERVDRSAEFLAYLPLSRFRILAGKLALALLVAVLIWGPNLLLLTFVIPEVWQPEAQGMETARKVLVGTAVTGLVFFSVGWLLSSLLESPTFAVFGSLLAPIAILLGIQALAWAYEYPFLEVVWPWYRRTCPLLALACFVAGTWCYLRRVEP